MDLNNNAKIIGIIIISIIFIIALFIIIDEIYNLTRFIYRYTYLYNYGIMNEKVCNKDKLEYETARFRIYNEINKYKLEKDIFNKTWLNYLSYIGIFILSILLLLSFGSFFYYIFIYENNSCIENSDNQSYLKQILECLCSDCHKFIPNCFFKYCILFILIIIYPLIFILKLVIKLDYTWNSGYYIKLLHILFFIILVYYIFVILFEKSGETTENKFNKALIYTFFIIIFYMNNYIFNKIFDEYNNITKINDLYNNKNENEKNADIIFFDIYKQEKPIEPIKIDIPSELKDFKIKSNDNIIKLSQEDLEKYKKIKQKIDNYYKKLAIYENDMKIYKDKYNIYQNNKIEFSDIIYILYTMFPQLFGLYKTEIQLFFILLIIIFILTYYLKINKNEYSNYVYYTIFIYIIGILSILIITNAVINYNTYINKYLIYEPINNYKNYLNNKNTIFNLIIKKDNSLIDFYKKTTGKFENIDTISVNEINIDDLINKIKKGNSFTNDYPLIKNDNNILLFQLKFYKTIYSYIFIEDNYISNINDNNNNNKYNKYNKYYIEENYINIKGNLNYKNYLDLKKYINILLISDEYTIKNRIKQLKNNFKYYIYNTPQETNLVNIILDKNVKYENINEKAINKIDEEYYNNYLYLINKSFDIYEELLKDCRLIFIELFNNLDIACNYSNYININEKIQELDNKISNKNKTNFKDINNEKSIEIYKKIIYLCLEKLNISLKKHINIIKIYMRLIESIDTISTNSNQSIKKIINKIINNYNIYANDEDKHSNNDFIKKLIKLKSNYIINKYNNIDSIELKKLNISTNNISWSFVILIIIFTIILLEPLII